MNRSSGRARIAGLTGVVLVSCVVLGGICGCEQLEGRNRVRKGNRLFHGESGIAGGKPQFVDAAAEYQLALKQVDDPIIHYNLGLAYQKIVKPGSTAPVLLGTKDELLCSVIPGTKMIEAGACVKPGDRLYAECGSAKTGPIEKEIADLEAQKAAATDDAKKKDLEGQIHDKHDELGRYTCSSSFKCVETTFCSLTSPELVDLAAQNFQTWIKAQPSDAEIKKQFNGALADLEDAKKSDNKSLLSATQKRVEELQIKDQTRKLMTQLWLDSEQYQKALDYWESLLQDRPNDPEIMGNLAGINLKAGNWKKSIEWYNKVADVTNDPSSKVAEYQFIGNVAWAKLNSRTLIGTDAIELADRGIGALQRAAEIEPKIVPKNLKLLPRLISLQASILNFRSTAHGASWAAAIDRANAEDLKHLTGVLLDEAKKAEGQAPGTPPAPAPGTPPAPAPPTPPTPPASPSATGGAAVKSGG